MTVLHRDWSHVKEPVSTKKPELFFLIRVEKSTSLLSFLVRFCFCSVRLLVVICQL